jgi:hypothetical protein
MLQIGDVQASILRLTDWALRVRRIAVLGFVWPWRIQIFTSDAKRRYAIVEVNICFRRSGINGITSHLKLEARSVSHGEGPTKATLRPSSSSDFTSFQFQLYTLIGTTTKGDSSSRAMIFL